MVACGGPFGGENMFGNATLHFFYVSKLITNSPPSLLSGMHEPTCNLGAQQLAVPIFFSTYR